MKNKLENVEIAKRQFYNYKKLKKYTKNKNKLHYKFEEKKTNHEWYQIFKN